MSKDEQEGAGPGPRVVLVTGASRGFGRAVAEALAGTATHLVLTARTMGGLEEADDAVRAAGGQATLVPLDLTAEEGLGHLGPVLAERFGRLDGLVAAAGMLGALGPVAHSDPSLWRQVIDLDLMAQHRLILAVDPLLRASRAGRAVFVTCREGAHATAYWNAQAVAKAGLEMLVRLYAAETARTGLKVNLLDPGPMATRLRAAAFPGEDPATLPGPAAIAPAAARLLDPSLTATGQRFLAADLLTDRGAASGPAAAGEAAGVSRN